MSDIMEKKFEKISSNGRIIIPKKWREALSLEDNQMVELELQDNRIIVTKKEHPLVKAIGLFDDIPDFTDEELEQAKKSLFKHVDDEAKN